MPHYAAWTWLLDGGRITRAMIRGLEAVFFDLDDTLFDRRSAQMETLRTIIRGFPNIFKGIEKQTITGAFLQSDHTALQEYNAGGSVDVARSMRSKAFLRILGLNEDYAQEITTMYVSSYPAANTPVAGAKLATTELAKRFQLGVISNGSPDVQYRKLETLGIKDLFSCIVLSEEIGIRKPDAGIFQKAIALLGNQYPDR